MLKSQKKIKRVQLQGNIMIKKTIIIKRKNINKKFKRIIKRKKSYKTIKSHLLTKMKKKNNRLRVFLIFTIIDHNKVKRKIAVKSQVNRNKKENNKMRNIMKTKVITINTIKSKELKA